MYKISLWASRHVWPARLLLITGLVLFTLLALFIGSALHVLRLSAPISLFYSAVVLFLAVFLIYPDKIYKHRFRNFYQYQKTCDGLLLGATLLMLVCIGNQPETLLQTTSPAAAVSTLKTNLPIEARIQPSQNKLSKKAIQQALVKKIKQLRKAYKESSTGGKIALIVLAVLVAAGLFFLLAGLSCSISCSGSDGLAILVFLLGTAAIVFLLVKVIHRITKGPRHKIPEAPAT